MLNAPFHQENPKYLQFKNCCQVWTLSYIQVDRVNVYKSWALVLFHTVKPKWVTILILFYISRNIINLKRPLKRSINFILYYYICFMGYISY